MPGDYHDRYNRVDVLLLADVFGTFRKTCMGQYSLHSANYYTNPGLSWDALLKKTGVELELVTDYDQHLFIEKALRSRISMASKRHARADNPLIEEYDATKPRICIVYLDANNHHGWAMSQPLLTGGFEWVEDGQSLQVSLAEHPADNPEGFILEVDLEYFTTNTTPTLWRRRAWWSKKSGCRSTSTTTLVLRGTPTEVEKLVHNFRYKDRYVLRNRNLQLYMSLGLRLTKINRALKLST